MFWGGVFTLEVLLRPMLRGERTLHGLLHLPLHWQSKVICYGMHLDPDVRTMHVIHKFQFVFFSTLICLNFFTPAATLYLNIS